MIGKIDGQEIVLFLKLLNVGVLGCVSVERNDKGEGF